MIPRRLLSDNADAVNGFCTAAIRDFDALWPLISDAEAQEARDAMCEAITGIVERYGPYAMESGKLLYEGARDLEVGDDGFFAVDGEVPANTYDLARWSAQYLFDDYDGKGSGADSEKAYRAARKTIDNQIRQYNRNAVRDNGLRDGRLERYARVPMGRSCDWCVMSAGHGFFYKSEATAAAMGHAHCDCQIVPCFKESTVIEGYDPDEYADMWSKIEEIDNAEFTTRELKDAEVSSQAEMREVLKGELWRDKALREAEARRPAEGSRAVESLTIHPSGGGGRVNYIKPESDFLDNRVKRDVVVHEALERYGFDVDVLPEDSVGTGHSNIDLAIGGKLVEVKSPNQPIVKGGENDYRFVEDSLRSARRQFNSSIDRRNDGVRRVIFNGVYCAYDDDEIAARIIGKMNELGIDYVLQLRKDGSFVLHSLRST